LDRKRIKDRGRTSDKTRNHFLNRSKCKRNRFEKESNIILEIEHIISKTENMNVKKGTSLYEIHLAASPQEKMPNPSIFNI
jgi:hypothetical protein